MHLSLHEEANELQVSGLTELKAPIFGYFSFPFADILISGVLLFTSIV